MYVCVCVFVMKKRADPKSARKKVCVCVYVNPNRFHDSSYFRTEERTNTIGLTSQVNETWILNWHVLISSFHFMFVCYCIFFLEDIVLLEVQFKK